jgi:post-segregation antitoxin (ccd killing protein)
MASPQFTRGAPSATRTRDLLLRRTLRWSSEPAETQVTDGLDASRVTAIERELQGRVARMWHAHGPAVSHLARFRSENGGVLYPSSYRYVWQQARHLALTPSQAASLLARRPYDLRHGGVSLRLNAGVPATQVAEWAGHSVEVLLTIYAKCITGRDQVWFDRIDRVLRGDES